MIKRIVFDFDNTLIPFLDEWNKEIENTFNYLNIPYKEDYFDIVHKALHEYEDCHLRYDKIEMSKYFNTKFDFEIPDNFVDVWVSKLSKLVPDDNSDIVKLIKYLSSKYSLVVASNWFYDQQCAKLKLAGLYEYFDEVYTADYYNRKPNPEMLEKAMEGYSRDEIVVVGDTYKVDTAFAMNMGIFSYLINKDIKKRSKKYKVLNNVLELRDYL